MQPMGLLLSIYPCSKVERTLWSCRTMLHLIPAWRSSQRGWMVSYVFVFFACSAVGFTAAFCEYWTRLNLHQWHAHTEKKKIFLPCLFCYYITSRRAPEYTINFAKWENMLGVAFPWERNFRELVEPQKHHFIFFCWELVLLIWDFIVLQTGFECGPCPQACEQTALKHLHLKSCTSVAELADAFFFFYGQMIIWTVCIVPLPPCSSAHICHVMASKLHRDQSLFAACVMPKSWCCLFPAA